MDQDLAYYSRRMLEEQKAGAEAATPEARKRHFELALAYEARLSELKAKKPRSILRIVTRPEQNEPIERIRAPADQSA